MAVSAGFWRGKNVLVTGHTGFKGSWLALWLVGLDAEVVGYSLEPPSSPSLFDLARVAEDVESVKGDVRDGDAVRRVVERHRPEIVIHMAAQSLVRRSVSDPVETYEVNVLGTVNVLEAVRATDSVRVVVNVTSDKCYEDLGDGRPHREEDAKGGPDPYSSSKGCAELVTSAYRTSFFADRPTALASARAGNVVGGGDWGEDRLVPDVMRAALSGQSACVRNPGAIRPWQHVLNPLAGYLVLAERLWADRRYAAGWNFGPDERDARPVRAIVDRLAELWPGGIAWEVDARDHPAEVQALRLDSSRARSQLGWSPRWDLDQALEATVAWYRSYAAGDDVRETTLSQLRAYAGESRCSPAPT